MSGLGESGEAPPEDIDAARTWARRRLEAALGSGAAGDARRLIDLARDRSASAGGLDATARKWLAAAISARAGRRPMSQISGRRDFYKSSFETGPDVLDPRPESEALVEAAVAFWPAGRAGRALDLGVGSGCLLISLLLERPELEGLGVDASPAALRMASRNAEALGVSSRVTLQEGDWDAGLSQRFDLVLSNPPYIPLEDWRGLEPDVRDYEPKAALTPGPDGLVVYRRLAGRLRQLLTPGGRAFFEVGQGQAADVAALCIRNGASTRTHRDLGGVERVVEVWFEA